MPPSVYSCFIDLQDIKAACLYKGIERRVCIFVYVFACFWRRYASRLKDSVKKIYSSLILSGAGGPCIQTST